MNAHASGSSGGGWFFPGWSGGTALPLCVSFSMATLIVIDHQHPRSPIDHIVGRKEGERFAIIVLEFLLLFAHLLARIGVPGRSHRKSSRNQARQSIRQVNTKNKNAKKKETLALESITAIRYTHT